MVIATPDCLHARSCPISQGPCPGECVFSDVMQSVSLGILVFDVGNSSLLFANGAARALLDGGGLAAEFAPARSAFSDGGDTSELASVRAGTCRLGARLVGYTSYSKGVMEWIFCRDISEKARLEAVAEAVELSNSFGHVFAAVRHEIGNPINSAKMALSVVRRSFDRLGREATLEYIDSTLKELDRVVDLLASLRSYSLYEDVSPVKLEVDAFLAEFAGFARRDFQQRGIGLTFRPGVPGVRAHGDPRALRQVLMGLLANSADALAQRRDAAISLDSAATESVVVLRLRDNGPGIAPESLPHLFKPFFTTKASGTGLGLVIARKMLARMSATIAIESQFGSGTCALITLHRVRQ